MSIKKPRRRMPEHVADAMAAILDYLWQDEVKDYLARTREEQANHIFTELLTVRQWLDRRDGPGEPKATQGNKKVKVTPGKPLT